MSKANEIRKILIQSGMGMIEANRLLLEATSELHRNSTEPTKRELFAAMAMQGMLAYGDASSQYADDNVPELAVAMADALLKELSKEGE